MGHLPGEPTNCSALYPESQQVGDVAECIFTVGMLGQGLVDRIFLPEFEASSMEAQL